MNNHKCTKLRMYSEVGNQNMFQYGNDINEGTPTVIS